MTMEKFDEGEQDEEEEEEEEELGERNISVGGKLFRGKKNGVTSCMGHRCAASFETALD